MPPVEDLENPNYKFATEIFSEDGKVLGTYSYSKENRVFVGYNDLSPHIINALIATEDVRFAEHSGIDAIALFRAVVKRGILMQKNAGGGSTISQQLSKQLYSPSADNIVERLFQKPIEWVIAVKLERYYTKEEILTMYLNKFDFLNNAVGIKTAAYTYFGCEPKDLKSLSLTFLPPHWWVCARILPFIIRYVITNVRADAAMWCSTRCARPDISPLRNGIRCRHCH